MEVSVTLSTADRRTVQDLLSERFGAPVRIIGLKAFPYSRVFRCTLEASRTAVPPTVIVWVSRDDPARSGLARLRNEHASLEFLRSLGSAIAPRFIAGHAAAGVLITEDLVTHPSLLALLLGDDEEAAREGLLAFARSLGALHAEAAGRAFAYNERRLRLGPADPDAEDDAVRFRVAESWRRVRDAVA